SFHHCCYFMYYTDQYTWGYNLPVLGSTVISYIDLGTSSTVITLALICNTKCFLKIRRLHAEISPTLPHHEIQRRKIETKLFIQFFIIFAYYAVLEILFNVVFRFLNGKWLGLIISLLYIGQCSINGFVYVGLNSAVREQIGFLFGKAMLGNSPAGPIFS